MADVDASSSYHPEVWVGDFPELAAVRDAAAAEDAGSTAADSWPARVATPLLAVLAPSRAGTPPLQKTGLDTFATIVSSLSTLDLLAISSTCWALNQLCSGLLLETGALELRGTSTSSARLLWLVQRRMRGKCRRIDVTDVADVTKARTSPQSATHNSLPHTPTRCALPPAQNCLAQCVAASPALEELVALRVGQSSWSAAQATRLLAAAPAAASLSAAARPSNPARPLQVHLDLRLELKNDLAPDSAILGRLDAATAPAAPSPLRVERLTLIADNVSAATGGGARRPSTAAAAAAAVDAAVAAMEQAAIAAPPHAEPVEEPPIVLEQLADTAPDTAPGGAHPHPGGDEPGGDASGAEGEGEGSEEVPALAALRRLSLALLRGQSAHLAELDASSGALSVAGAAEALLSPLLRAPHAALRSLNVASLAPGSMQRLAPALVANRSLRQLDLRCNMFSMYDAKLLAAALPSMGSLRSLLLDQNPILDPGGAALVATLPRTGLSSLSLAFTGAGDAVCLALAAAMREGCRLRHLTLTGNLVTKAGATALAEGLPAGGLRSLTLSSNLKLAPPSSTATHEAAIALARALPLCGLRELALSGCAVEKRACSQLAAALPKSQLASLDLGSNHFGDEGGWEFAWVLRDCTALRTLQLSDCDLSNDAADEFLEALLQPADGAAEGGAAASEPPAVQLRSLDLRYNKLRDHPLASDGRVRAGFQKGLSAAERKRDEQARAEAAKLAERAARAKEKEARGAKKKAEKARRDEVERAQRAGWAAAAAAKKAAAADRQDAAEARVGLEVQAPWSELLLRGSKSVETRRYPLPAELLGVPLALIGTAQGKAGVSALPDHVPAGESRLLGLVTFGEQWRYSTREQWRADEPRHAVPQGSAYDWVEEPPGQQDAAAAGSDRWGWCVQSVRPFASPLPAPPLARQARSLFALDWA